MSQEMVVRNLDTLGQFNAEILEEHACQCSAGLLKVVEQERNNWELEHKYHCGFCKKNIHYEHMSKARHGYKKG